MLRSCGEPVIGFRIRIVRLRGDALLEPGTAAQPTCPSKDWFSEGRPAIVSRPRSRTLWGRQRSTCVLLLATHHVTVAHSYFRDSNVRADRSTLSELGDGLMNPRSFASCRRPRGEALKRAAAYNSANPSWSSISGALQGRGKKQLLLVRSVNELSMSASMVGDPI